MRKQGGKVRRVHGINVVEIYPHLGGQLASRPRLHQKSHRPASPFLTKYSKINPRFVVLRSWFLVRCSSFVVLAQAGPPRGKDNRRAPWSEVGASSFDSLAPHARLTLWASLCSVCLPLFVRPSGSLTLAISISFRFAARQAARLKVPSSPSPPVSQSCLSGRSLLG